MDQTTVQSLLQLLAQGAGDLCSLIRKNASENTKVGHYMVDQGLDHNGRVAGHGRNKNDEIRITITKIVNQ